MKKKTIIMPFSDITKSKYKTKAYNNWCNMHRRCYGDKKPLDEENYTTVCDKWFEFDNFFDWYKDNSYKPKDGDRLTLTFNTLNEDNREYNEEQCLWLPSKLVKYLPRNLPLYTPDITRNDSDTHYIVRVNYKVVGRYVSLTKAQKVWKECRLNEFKVQLQQQRYNNGMKIKLYEKLNKLK